MKTGVSAVMVPSIFPDIPLNLSCGEGGIEAQGNCSNQSAQNRMDS